MFYSEKACSLEDFALHLARVTEAEDAPHAAAILKNIPVYDCEELRGFVRDNRKVILREIADILLNGAGVFVIKGAFKDRNTLDATSKAFEKMIEQEREANLGGDHFAANSANDRIWNALEKLCLAAPTTFVDYYANDMIALAAEAWLGPNYQITSQINVVRPGGQSQQMHRDYHLGFQTTDEASRYPPHVHQLSPALTLQGAIAHCEMPIESGPTKLLPFSQTYDQGYVAWRREDFISYFEKNCVQLPLSKGDAVFFNPALFHAAGANGTTNISRMANLLQISSAFGRAMETIDRATMSKTIYPIISATDLDAASIQNVIAATGEGYSFPTNLDRDPPLNGLAPKTQQQLLAEAIKNRWSTDKLDQEIGNSENRKLSGA